MTKAAYTLIELLISVTLMSLMAILGIIAFGSYGKSTVFSEKIVEVESLIKQLDIISKNPEKDAFSYCLFLDEKKSIVGIYKGLDRECKNRTSVREVSLNYDQKIINSGTMAKNNLLVCDILGTNCYMKENDDSLTKIQIVKNNYFFSILNAKHLSNFYLSAAPFMVEVK